ncbi:hypothetical protein C3L33_01819, partial [Rhododendron williamsianum]
METSPRTKSAHKLVKSQSAVQSGNAAARGGVRYSPPHQAIKSPSWSILCYGKLASDLGHAPIALMARDPRTSMAIKAVAHALPLPCMMLNKMLAFSGILSPQSRDEVKERLVEKSKVSQKTPAKENTKSQDFKLHTQERAVKRAMFNYEVSFQPQKKYTFFLLAKASVMIDHQTTLMMIEEEEVRMLRKEMIPRAQLMPFFDKPFFPQ